ESTRPIEFPVHAPSDAEGMFDVLTYEKGASVLRMLEQHVGEEEFREGVRLYLQKHAYANAETNDLFASLGEAAEQDVPAMMAGWIYRPGYPLVEVRRQGRSVVLSQRRFRYLPSEGGEQGQPWQVPVQVRVFTADGPEVVRKVLRDGEL